MPEKTKTVLRWEVAEGSSTAHAIDSSRPAWRNADGSRRVSGPRALCGRYPQRNANDAWFALAVNEPDVLGALFRYGANACDECAHKLRA